MALLEFTEEHNMFRETVRRFVEKEVRPYVEEWEREGRTPRELWRKCGKSGFFGLHYPPELGGMGGDFTYTLIFHEEMGACGSAGTALGLAVQSDMATPALAKYGSDELRARYLVPAIKGEFITSIAVSEPGHGSDVAAIETRAAREGDEWVLNGRKTFVTNGTQSDFLVLLARTFDAPGFKGLSLFVVPTDCPGLDRGRPLRKTCYHSSDTAEIALENVRIPAGNLIGEEGHGFYYQMEQFQIERLAGAAMGLGGMKRAWDLTYKYVHEREAFGAPLAKMQVVRHKLAQTAAEIRAIEALAHRCVALANRGNDITEDVSILKLLTAETIQRVSEECVQLHGGNGLMEEYEVARIFRDAKLMGIGGGTNEIMREIICKCRGLEP